MNVASLGGTVISSPYCANKSKEKLGETDSSPESGSSSSEIKDEYVPSPKKESTLNAPLTYSNKDIQKCSFDSTQNNTELPESVFNYFEQKMPAVSTIVNNIKSSIHNYMNGTGSFDDIKSCIKQAYSDVQDYNISLGRIDGTNAEENTKILTALYQEAIYNTNTMCQMANTAEERSVAFSKGMDASDRFAYYNSKYYYCFKEIKQATKAACADIATDQHLTEFDAEEVERTHNGPGCWDFNTYWAGNLRDNKKIGTMLDPGAEPPRNFRMFYSQSTEYAKHTFTGGDISKIDDGELTIFRKDQCNVYTIPFAYYSEHIKQLFDISEIIPSTDRCEDFLKSFLFYRYYLYG